MRGTTYLLATANVASVAAKLGIFVVLTQAGGFEVAGAYTLGLAIVTPVFLLCGLSLREIFVTSHDELTGRTVLVLRLAACGIGVVVVGGAALLLHPSQAPLWVALACYRTTELLVDLELARLQRAGGVAAMSGVVALFAVSTASLLAGVFLSSHMLAGSVFAAAFMGGCIFLALVRARAGARAWWRRPLDSSAFGAVLGCGLPLSVSAFAVSLGTNVPVMILGSTHGTATVGVYSAIYNISSVSNILYSSVAQVELRGFVELAAASQVAVFLRRGRRLVLDLGLIAVLGSVGVYFFGVPVFTFVFGEDFAGFELELMLMCATVVISGMGFVSDTQLTALQRFQSQGFVSILTLGFTIVLGLLLIPRYGSVGALLVVFATMLVRNVIKGWLVRRALLLY